MVLDAPTHVHLAYRPGVPLVTGAWRAGRPDLARNRDRLRHPARVPET